MHRTYERLGAFLVFFLGGGQSEDQWIKTCELVTLSI